MNSRSSINVPGLEHGNQPIPSASRIGNILVTGGVMGIVSETGEVAETLADQVRHMFKNLGAILQAADCTFDCVIKVTVWIREPEARKALNREWIRVFPDPTSRPARHTMQTAALHKGLLVQCEAMAVVPTLYESGSER